MAYGCHKLLATKCHLLEELRKEYPQPKINHKILTEQNSNLPLKTTMCHEQTAWQIQNVEAL